MIKRIKSKSEKRLIIEVIVNDKKAFMLIDTGASVGFMDSKQRKDYGLIVGKDFQGSLVGAGGTIHNVKHCKTMADFEGKVIPQFLLADISDIVKSIKRETGIEILGIVSLKQMAIIGLNIDVNSNEVWLE